MLAYKPQLKPLARGLRAAMTDAEHRLWFRLRRKQLLGVQFYRQKPIGKYIVHLCAPAVALVIEVGGGQQIPLTPFFPKGEPEAVASECQCAAGGLMEHEQLEDSVFFQV